jgi:aspartate carbamoyltransferase catalytic subunit
MRKTRSLLGIDNLEPDEILSTLKLARRMDPRRMRPLLKSKKILLLFYEASTRTRVSFELAAKALGATTSHITAQTSSIEKGESLLDTGYTLRAAGADAIVMRHPNSGAAAVLSRYLPIPIINAGDGMHEHPTQALLDAYTMLRHFKSLKGLKVSIVGDIFHSRVARSNVHLLGKMGAHVTLCGPAELLPEVASALAPGVHITRHMDEAVRHADVVMMLRVQKERLQGLNLNVSDYVSAYQMTVERLRLAHKNAIVMHPGPIMRGVELQHEVADCGQSVILEQVANGVPVRMAVLAQCLGVA